MIEKARYLFEEKPIMGQLAFYDRDFPLPLLEDIDDPLLYEKCENSKTNIYHYAEALGVDIADIEKWSNCLNFQKVIQQTVDSKFFLTHKNPNQIYQVVQN